MEKKDVISAIEQLMKENKLTREELIAYWNTPQETLEEIHEYPFEVMYDDGTRSWSPQKDKKIWGVIFCDNVISLKNTKEKLPWKKAVEYCQQIKIGNMTGSAGSKTFWETLQMQEQKKIKELNQFILKLGGDKLSGSFWTNEKHDKSWSYFVFWEQQKKGIAAYFKNIRISVRPILSLV